MWNSILLLDLLGYVASALVAISLMMSNIVKLRVINSIGALCFVIYGMLVPAYPVALVNGLIVIINIVNLKRFFRDQN